jgi:HEAT repeat protein
MELWDDWDDFLKVIASDHNLTVDQKAVFFVRLSRQSIDEKRTNQEIANEVIGGEPHTALSAYNKRMKEVFNKLSHSFPEIKSESTGKVGRTQACLEKAYLEQQNKKKSEVVSDVIAPPDWHKICREMLKTQKQSIRRQATEIVSEPFYVQLGLVERRHKPRHSGDFSLSPEQGSGFFQLEKEEIIETYEHDEFLEQVIKEKQSKKSQGKRIAIIGEPGAGKTTLLESIAFSPKTPGFPIWISLSSLGEKSLEEYLRQKWLKDALPFISLEAIDVTPELEKELAKLFNGGEVLLLLDGVDEMPASSPVEALAKIRHELTGWVAKARVVLTCRVNVWDTSVNGLQGFDTYRTLPFEYEDGNKPDQVTEFICQWFSKTDKPELGEPLRKKLDEERHQRIRDLVKNPLRLSLLCQSWYFKQGDLPKTKAALYEQFTRAFYEWKKERHSTSLTQRKELNAALGRLAREAIDKEKSRFGIRESFALNIMGEVLFNLACKLHWLIHVYNDADTYKKVYAFFHPTFQEYFAACAIDHWDYFLHHNNENPNPFLKHNGKDCVYRIFEPQWKQVILLWLGRPEEEVPKKQKEAFIEVLLEFEDGCFGLYPYLAHFLAAAGIAELKDCIYADEIVGMLVDWYADAEIWTFMTVVNPVITNEARIALLESDRATVIKILIYVLNSDFVDYDSRWKVFNLLEQIGTGNSEVVVALTQLIDHSTDNEELQQDAAFFLGRISPGNQKAINLLKQQLLKKKLPDWLDSLPLRAAYFLGIIDRRNQDAINYLINWINQNDKYRLKAASFLGKIDPSNSVAIEALTELVKTERGDLVMNIPLIAARELLEINSENPEAISFLREFIKSGRFLFLWERLEAASALGKTQQYKQEAIQVICEIANEIIQTRTGKEQQLLHQCIDCLNHIDLSIFHSFLSCQQKNILSRGLDINLENAKDWACILALTKHYLETEEDYLEAENHYKHIWICATNMNYSDFYSAWHSRVYSRRTEAGENITVIKFNTVQSSVRVLENQLIDIPSQLQATDKTYPITLDTQTLKLETNTSNISQKLCTKIHRKADYSEIPTANDAAQLQQYIPRIQAQLQKPNLALILHGCEPNQHLIDFCYSLADRDLGIYISLITSQPIEQPLKGFLPNQENLISAIQTWIDEIG